MRHNSSPNAERRPLELAWLEGLKAFAILGILLNHLVEEFGPGPWFTNPSRPWPSLAERLSTLFPTGDSWPLAAIRFLGWLGDAGPGVFIAASGFGLAFAALRRGTGPEPVRVFYLRRAARLYPLYVAMHVVILGAALSLPVAAPSMADPRTLASMLGLRFTNTTFFYISPSWWFVWLILQMYVVFPFLLRALRAHGPARFLLGALAITIASRAVGIVFADQLYFWMTGKFFGTRLAEFALGMVVAHSVHTRRSAERPTTPARALAVGGGAYVAGFAASLFLPTTVVSNFLVTIGLCGIFYASWRLLEHLRPLRDLALRIGALAFTVFLLHQPLLKWTGQLVERGSAGHLLAALAVLGLCFPAGALLERSVQWLVGGTPAAWLRRLGVAVALVLAGVMLIGQPVAVEHGGGGAVATLLGAGIALLALAEVRRERLEPTWTRVLRWSVAGGAVTQLWLLPPDVPYLGLLAGGVVGGVAATLLARGRHAVVAWAVGILASAVVCGGAELLVRQVAPAQAGAWGELPVLTTHPKWGYALKPGLTARLKYDRYDYPVRTNQLGLPGPEIPEARSAADTLRILITGDAFTMPEGLPYEASYPALLQQRLDSCLGPDASRVINAGVTGYGPNEAAAQLADLIAQLRPRAVIYQFFVNEFTEVNLTRERRLADIGLIRSRGLRGGMLASLHLGVRLREAAERMAELATGRPAASRTYNGFIRLHERGSIPAYADTTLAKLSSRLEEMRDAARAAGASFGLLYVPAAVAVRPAYELAYLPWDLDPADTTRFDLERPWRAVRQLADSLWFFAVNAGPALRAPTTPTYFRHSWHWTRAGQQTAVDVAASLLAGMGVTPMACAEHEASIQRP